MKYEYITVSSDNKLYSLPLPRMRAETSQYAFENFLRNLNEIKFAKKMNSRLSQLMNCFELKFKL